MGIGEVEMEMEIEIGPMFLRRCEGDSRMSCTHA